MECCSGKVTKFTEFTHKTAMYSENDVLVNHLEAVGHIYSAEKLSLKIS